MGNTEDMDIGAMGNLHEVQKKIFEEWKIQWIRSGQNLEKDYFYGLFTASYGYTCNKCKKNKKYNFNVKKTYLAVLIGVPAARFAAMLFQAFFYPYSSENRMGTDWTDLLTDAAVIALAILLAAVVAKWNDIMKYQETWARHSDTKYKLENEMYFFITDSGAYEGLGTEEKRKKFITRIFAIWDENNAKFVKNMEEKEKPLTDTLKIIRGEDS